jgi:hypothetical protein
MAGFYAGLAGVALLFVLREISPDLLPYALYKKAGLSKAVGAAVVLLGPSVLAVLFFWIWLFVTAASAGHARPPIRTLGLNLITAPIAVWVTAGTGFFALWLGYEAINVAGDLPKYLGRAVRWVAEDYNAGRNGY